MAGWMAPAPPAPWSRARWLKLHTWEQDQQGNWQRRELLVAVRHVVSVSPGQGKHWNATVVLEGWKTICAEEGYEDLRARLMGEPLVIPGVIPVGQAIADAHADREAMMGEPAARRIATPLPMQEVVDAAVALLSDAPRSRTIPGAFSVSMERFARLVKAVEEYKAAALLARGRTNMDGGPGCPGGA